MAEQRRITINGRPVAAGQGVAPRGAQPAPKKAYRLPEARRAAAAAMDQLGADFPNAPWLHQARDGLELYLQRCIEQFSGTPQPSNAAPITNGADYREYARSAEEIKATMAAEEAAVSSARNVPRYRERPDEVEIPEQELADPMQAQPAKPKGWAL